MEIELERTFLLKEIPQDLKNCKFVEIIDVYIPKTVEHPILRIRKKGNNFEMTKKSPVVGDDASKQSEQTISLSEKEFSELSKLEGKKLRKNRYYYPINNMVAEIDFYLDDLEGLALVDFEFNSTEEKTNFVMPNFCLVDVTQEKIAAGGMLAGMKYSDIKPSLDKYNYKKIKLG
jgi:CYTH domain-containing protein